MEKFLGRFSEFGYLIFRLGVAFLFVFHGLQKLFGWYGGSVVPLMSLGGLAGVIEVAAPPLLAVGLFTRLTAFLAAGEMLAAYYLSHMPIGRWPIQNRGELALLFFLAFLYMMVRGGGKYSLDRLVRKTP